EQDARRSDDEPTRLEHRAQSALLQERYDPRREVGWLRPGIAIVADAEAATDINELECDAMSAQTRDELENARDGEAVGLDVADLAADVHVDTAHDDAGQ